MKSFDVETLAIDNQETIFVERLETIIGSSLKNLSKIKLRKYKSLNQLLNISVDQLNRSLAKHDSYQDYYHIKKKLPAKTGRQYVQ